MGFPRRRSQLVETLPHPSVHMIFEGGKSRITGVARAKFTRTLKGKGGVFAAKFRPGGFYPFAGFPVSQLSDTTVPLVNVFGAEGEKLDRAVVAEDSDAGRIALIEALLVAGAARSETPTCSSCRRWYAVARERGILRSRTWSNALE